MAGAACAHPARPLPQSSPFHSLQDKPRGVLYVGLFTRAARRSEKRTVPPPVSAGPAHGRSETSGDLRTSASCQSLGEEKLPGAWGLVSPSVVGGGE